jgi:hypothetical protein
MQSSGDRYSLEFFKGHLGNIFAISCIIYNGKKFRIIDIVVNFCEAVFPQVIRYRI